MTQSNLMIAAKAVIKDAAFNNPRKPNGKPRPTQKVKTALLEELHTAAIEEHELGNYVRELESGITAYAQATLNRASALRAEGLTDEQRAKAVEEFITDMIVCSTEQLQAFAEREKADHVPQ